MTFGDDVDDKGSEMIKQKLRNSSLSKEDKEEMIKNAKSDFELYLMNSENFVNNVALFKQTGNLGEAFSDPLRETGFMRDQTRRETGLLALTNAKGFSKSRDTALSEVAQNIKGAYYTAFEQYAQAGYSTVECKVKALSAAKIARTQGEESVLARFGTLETKMADMDKVKKAQVELSGFDLSAR